MDELHKNDELSEENQQYLNLLQRIGKFVIGAGSAQANLVGIAMKSLVLASMFSEKDSDKEKILTSAMSLKKFL